MNRRDLLDSALHALALVLPLAKGYEPPGATPESRASCRDVIDAAERVADRIRGAVEERVVETDAVSVMAEAATLIEFFRSAEPTVIKIEPAMNRSLGFPEQGPRGGIPLWVWYSVRDMVNRLEDAAANENCWTPVRDLDDDDLHFGWWMQRGGEVDDRPSTMSKVVAERDHVHFHPCKAPLSSPPDIES